MGASEPEVLENQILVVVDIYPGVSKEALEAKLPDRRKDRKILSLVDDFRAPRLEQPPRTKPVDWYSLGEAIEALGVRVHELQEKGRPSPTKLYLGGNAPLSVFVHLGFVFTKSIKKVVVFNVPPGGGDWQAFAMDGLETGVPPRKIYDREIGFPKEPLPATGRVGIFVDSTQRSDDPGPFASFIKGRNEAVAGILQLRTWESLIIDDVRMPAIVSQFAQLMSEMSGYCPERNGLAIFTSGPAQVSFALGRAMSPNVLVGDVVLTEYLKLKNEYEYVYSLPFTSRVESEIPQTPEAKQERARILDAIIAALAELKRDVKPHHLPDDVLNAAERELFINRLQELTILPDQVDKQPFQLLLQEGECRLGEGILHALVLSSPVQQKQFAKLLLLHEILHDLQGLRHTNHSLIGRAGFVLEHIDYLADVFAVRTLVHVDVEKNDDETNGNVRASARKWIDMVLHGIEAFDKAEQGPEKMERLAERRLRRYLLWHVQFSRIRTIRTQTHFDRVMTSHVTVELAPLSGWVDAKRWEKMVNETLEDTELCIAVDGRLVRAGKGSDFLPYRLLQALLAYSRAGAQKEVNAIVDQHRAVLMPWTQEK